jgi:hypothetical protein
MKDLFTKRMPLVLLLLFVWLTWQMVSSWVVVRFVHYDAQYRALEPDTYQAKIITPEDYALLQDSTKESVTLSDGSTYSDRQPSFYEHMIPSYKQIGDHYLLVTTIGTSHYYYRWISDMVPLMIPIILGVIAATLHYRRQTLATESVRE